MVRTLCNVGSYIPSTVAPANQPQVKTFQDVVDGDPKAQEQLKGIVKQTCTNIATTVPYFLIPGGVAAGLAKKGLTNPYLIATVEAGLAEAYHKGMQQLGIEEGKASDLDWHDAVNVGLPFLAPVTRTLVNKFLEPATEAVETAIKTAGPTEKLHKQQDKKLM
jgi:hypothetical protein